MLANIPPALKQAAACLRTFRRVLKQAFARTRIAALLFNAYLPAKRPKGVIFSVNVRNKNLENKCFYQKLVVLDPYFLVFFRIEGLAEYACSTNLNVYTEFSNVYSTEAFRIKKGLTLRKR